MQNVMALSSLTYDCTPGHADFGVAIDHSQAHLGATEWSGMLLATWVTIPDNIPAAMFGGAY